MEYGRISEENLKNIDISLPADGKENDAILGGKPATTKIWMGAPKWGKKEWIGKLYPKGTKDKDFLENYCKHFNAIELGATHYKIHTKEEVEKWAVKVRGKDFKFCPKVTNDISHYSGFVNVQDMTARFFEGIRAFGENLGAVLLQVSEKFSPNNRSRLYDYLQALPRDPQVFLEVRHPDWIVKTEIAQELFETLRKNKTGLVITDTLAHRHMVHMELTVPKTLIRFTCFGNHPSDFTRIDEWAQRIKSWQERGLKETYFFVHSIEDRLTPEMSKYVSETFNKVCNAGLPEIKFLPTLF